MSGADGKVVNMLILLLLIQCGTVVADHTGELMYDTCFIGQDESGTDHNFCIMIYDYGNTGHSWEIPSGKCFSLNSNLLAIFNSEMYREIQTILGRVFGRRTGIKIWIGGWRPPANNWMKINKDLFNKTVAGTFEGNCLSMQFSGINIQYDLDECSEMSGSHNVLCQFSPTAGSCGDSAIKIDNVCYSRPPNYTGAQISWFDARNECLKLPDGDLAYNNIEQINGTHWNQLGLGTSSVWVGVWRKPWLWNSEPVPFDMKYTAWASGEGDEFLDDCTMLEYSGDQDGTAWRSTSCSEILKFYICYNGQPITTHAPEEPTTQSNSDSLEDVDEGGEQYTRGQVIGLSAGLAAGGLLLTVTAVIVTFFITRRRYQTQSPIVEVDTTVVAEDLTLDEIPYEDPNPNSYEKLQPVPEQETPDLPPDQIIDTPNTGYYNVGNPSNSAYSNVALENTEVSNPYEAINDI